ncbi:hypothetical protein [Neisseria iguanae]|uniref:hypothetical protein n=1 Tax=Neisseria iguanae TaxID=90242 RepID=UPI001FE3B8A0|nr:hypothetical protein [Neisseria iguanae]
MTTGCCSPASWNWHSTTQNPAATPVAATKSAFPCDFITAPTVSLLFVQTLTRQLNTPLPQTTGNVYEFGSGTGRLAADLATLLSDGIKYYYIIELSA